MAFNSKFQSKKASAEFFFLCHSFFCFCFCLFVFLNTVQCILSLKILPLWLWQQEHHGHLLQRCYKELPSWHYLLRKSYLRFLLLIHVTGALTSWKHYPHMMNTMTMQQKAVSSEGILSKSYWCRGSLAALVKLRLVIYQLHLFQKTQL